jgi:hypothetical protein
MANKQKQLTQKKEVQETWRKPLQVPPRSNAMRNFYQGSEEKPASTVNAQESLTPKPSEETLTQNPPQNVKTTEKKAEKGKLAAKSPKENSQFQGNRGKVINSISNTPQKMTAEELTNFLEFEIEDLFDVNELLRGKSLEMYQILIQGRDEKGRYKITQPELMKRTGIKNRRTFYKHEQWLINLHLLEKRHLPGDHKGVVYRIFDISEVLPVPSELVEEFEKILKNSE